MSSAVRKGDYKLISFYYEERDKLYNLANDPSEENNLAQENLQKLEELKFFWKIGNKKWELKNLLWGDNNNI